MSDDSAKKVWDGWFGGDEEPSGGGSSVPEPEATPEPEREVPAAPPEAEEEQTDWTMPPVKEAPEPAVTEPRQSEPEPEPVPAPEPEPLRWAPEPEPEQPSADAMETRVVDQPTPIVEQPTQVVTPPSPDSLATRILSAPTPPADAQPTEVVPQTPPAQSPAAPTNTWQPPQPAQMWGETQQAQPQRGYAGGANQQGAPAAQQPVRPQPASPSPVYHVPPPEPQAYRSAPPQRPSAPPAEDFATNEERPHSRKKLFLASGIGAAAIVGLATVLVLNQGSLTGSGAAAKPTPSGFQPTGTSVTADAEQTAQVFLAAWASGNFKQAATYTDDPAAAQSTLAAFGSNLNLGGLQLAATGSTALAAAASSSAGASTAATASASASSSASYGSAAPTGTAGAVTFSVAAKVGLPASATSSSAAASSSASASSSAAASASASTSSSSGTVASSVTANWSYSSKLVAYKKNGGWWIQWDPSLVAPNLTAGEKLVSVPIAPSASEVTDDAGNSLSSATDPGVHNIYNALKKSAPVGQGTPGVEVVLEKADGTQISSSADVLSQPVNTGVVKTTFNAKAEAAAQAAVSKYTDSSMVVLQPSTGDILAVANNDGGNDFALTARIAPGSTNKIITSTALLTSGLLSSPSQAVECPAKIVVDGTTFANSQNESEPAGTPFLTDFAVSCNNAFGQWYNKIGSTTLAQTAQKYYGLNEQWNLGTGLAGPYYQIPSSSSNGELFQELFGQGQLEAAPLAMASVAATVDTGTFKQPIVVQGAAQTTATPLPSNVQQALWQMMKAVTTQSDGTAAGVFSGVNSTVYGKTGTADVGSGQAKPNSWMVVFDPKLDLAIGTVVLNAGYGASFAGPEEAQVLAALQ
ncbi:MAG TPA: penicillin-binding transpeptidase domain-containing protein [Actinospica sp.]|nr:penicillin-binding transpeptidase domain-containing protein [Actinospica sp.]